MYVRTMRRLRLLIVLLGAALTGQVLRTVTKGATFGGGVSEGITTFLLLFSLAVRRQGLQLKQDESLNLRVEGDS